MQTEIRIKAKQQKVVSKKCSCVNSVWCSKYDYMSAAGLFSVLQWRTWGHRVAKCWLIAASETLHSQRAQVAGSLGLCSSASHSQCGDVKMKMKAGPRHHAEEQAATWANYWSQQIKEVYPDNVSGYSLYLSFFAKKISHIYLYINIYCNSCWSNENVLTLLDS